MKTLLAGIINFSRLNRLNFRRKRKKSLKTRDVTLHDDEKNRILLKKNFLLTLTSIRQHCDDFSQNFPLNDVKL